MFGDIENKADKTRKEGEKNSGKIFSTRATVVTYFGGETGNTLSNLMNFSTGIPWKDIPSSIHQVTGDEGEDKQGRIDGMMTGQGTTGYGTADYKPISEFLKDADFVSSKIFSFGKFALGLNGQVGIEDAAF